MGRGSEGTSCISKDERCCANGNQENVSTYHVCPAFWLFLLTKEFFFEDSRIRSLGHIMQKVTMCSVFYTCGNLVQNERDLKPRSLQYGTVLGRENYDLVLHIALELGLRLSFAAITTLEIRRTPQRCRALMSTCT